MLTWIRLEVSLPTHPKADALDAALGAVRSWTHLVELWLWVATARPDGRVGDLPPEIIARRAGWRGDAGAFVHALKRCGWIDDDGMLHGWSERQSERVFDRPRAPAPRQRGVVGLAERAGRPASPEDLHEKIKDVKDKDGKPRWPALDGVNGRPSLLDRLQALWPNYLAQYDTNGPDVARARLAGWLAEDNARHRRSLEDDRKSGAAAAQPSNDRELQRTRRMLNERDRGAEDRIGGDEARALVSGLRKQIGARR